MAAPKMVPYSVHNIELISTSLLTQEGVRHTPSDGTVGKCSRLQHSWGRPVSGPG